MNKQYILDEIKRTAMANGGNPIGRDAFFRETGIKYTDWFGKFWARWSDAVQEAGLTPNEFKTTNTYDDEVLIEKYIAQIRSSGRFPVKGEIRLSRRDDKSLPSEYTFRKRVGSKQAIINKLKVYCSQRSGYEDILAICESEMKDIAEDQQYRETSGQPDEVTIGQVYLIKVGKYYKIGRTNAIGRREYELSIQLPEKGQTIHAIRTDDPSGIEAYWHKRFDTKRKNGEWFELTNADINAFKRRKFM